MWEAARVKEPRGHNGPGQVVRACGLDLHSLTLGISLDHLAFSLCAQSSMLLNASRHLYQLDMRVMFITLIDCYCGFEVLRPSTSGLFLITQENSEDHSESGRVVLRSQFSWIVHIVFNL